MKLGHTSDILAFVINLKKNALEKLFKTKIL